MLTGLTFLAKGCWW